MLCAADRTRVVQLISLASEVNYTGKKAALSQPKSECASLCVRRILESRLYGEHGESNLQSPETGRYYFNQRYYDPSLGRFLTEDPAGQGLNPYAYAGMLVRDSGCESAFATSLSLINPDGLFFFEIGTFVGAAYGALIGGTQRMLSGGDFGEGAVDGFILGAKIGGTIGAAADGYTGGYATWTDSNPFFTLAAHTYAEAWNGRAGGGYGFGLDLNAGAGGGGNPAAPLYQPQYPQELSDGFDAYTQTGAVPESDFCYPCGGAIDDLRDFRNDLQASFKELYMRSGMTFLDWHYFRGSNNKEHLAVVRMSEFESTFHGGQAKYVSPDGHHEAVYDRGGRLLGGRYGGSYNYYPANNRIGHIRKDVIPYLVFGN